MPCKYEHDLGEKRWYIGDDNDVMIKVLHVKQKGASLSVLRVASILLEGKATNYESRVVKECESSFTWKGKTIKGYQIQFNNGKVQEIYGCANTEGTTMIVLQEKRKGTEKNASEKFLAMRKHFIATIKLQEGSTFIR